MSPANGGAPPARAGLRAVVRREARRIAGSPFMLIFLFALPPATFLLMTAVFSRDIPRDLPVAVCDQDNSALSRRIVRAVDATPALALSVRAHDLAEGAAAVRRGDAYGLVHLPAGLSRDALRGDALTVTVFFNNQWFLTSGLMNRAVRDAVLSVGGEMERRARIARGESPGQAGARMEPVLVDQRGLFNPGTSYGFFLLPALLPTLLQGFIVVVTVRAAAGELRRRTAGEWLEAAGGSAAVAILGKLLPYTLVFLCVSLLMWTVALRWYGAPMRGDWRVLAGATALFVLAYQSMGLLFAALTANIRVANSLAGFYCGPAFAVAGVTFPAAGLSAPAVVWSLGLPLTHYLRIVLQQCMQGAPPASALAPMAALCAFAFLPPLVYVPRLGRLLRDPSAWGRL